MSVQIIGKRHLDSNWYNQVVIREQDSGYRVDVKDKDKIKFPRIATSTKFSDSIKYVSDEEKIKMVIDDFLNNSLISSLEDFSCIRYYEGKFSIIKSENRELDIQINNQKLIDTIKKITSTYFQNRLNFIYENSDVNYYELYLSSRKTSYEIVDSNFCKYIKFNLKCNDKGLLKKEKEFLEDFLISKFMMYDDNAIIGTSEVFSASQDTFINFGYHVGCGNFKMSIPNHSYIRSEIYNIVTKYNKERESAKVLQLKLKER